MLTATNHGGPTFHTLSRTAQCNLTEYLTPQPKTDTVTPDITKVTDTPDTMPKPLTEDRLQALLRCKGQIHTVNASPSIYQTEKHQNMKFISFYTAKDYCINRLQIQTRKFLALIIPKSLKYTVLMEAHDKLGHQEAPHTYCIIKHQYY